MAAEGTERRIKVVDLLRTISIIAVLANHYFGIQFSPPAENLHFLQKLIGAGLFRFAWSGAYGVSIFFVLSGYLITRMTAERNDDLYLVNRRHFYVRRAGRILPLLLLILSLVLVVVLACGSKPEVELPQSLQVIFHPDISSLNLAFFLSFFTFSLNWLFIFSSHQYGMQLSILWSIAVEEQFYLFLPLTLRTTGNSKRFVPLLLSLISLGPLARWLGNGYQERTFAASFTNSFGSFDLIAMGVLLFLLEGRCRTALNSRKWLSPCICLAGFTIGTVTYLTTVTGNPLDRIYAPTLLGVGVFLSLLGGLQIRRFQSLPNWLTLPGELSYGMYLYHPMVLFLLWPFLLGKDSSIGFPIYVLCTVGLGWLSFHFFERPMNRLIRMRFITSARRPN